MDDIIRETSTRVAYPLYETLSESSMGLGNILGREQDFIRWGAARGTRGVDFEVHLDCDLALEFRHLLSAILHRFQLRQLRARVTMCDTV